MRGEKKLIEQKRLLKPMDQICFGGGQIVLTFNLDSHSDETVEALDMQPSARLIVLKSAIPEYKGVTFNIDKKEISLGRVDCDIVFSNDARISRKHAIIRYNEDKQVYQIIDLASSNGVTVRDNLIPANTPVEIKNSDVIGIGAETQLIFEVDN